MRGLAGDQRRALLWDARRFSKPDPLAWSETIDHIDDLLIAVAAVVGEGETALLGPYPEVIDSLLVPFKVFADHNTALAWLRTFLG